MCTKSLFDHVCCFGASFRDTLLRKNRARRRSWVTMKWYKYTRKWNLLFGGTVNKFEPLSVLQFLQILVSIFNEKGKTFCHPGFRVDEVFATPEANGKFASQSAEPPPRNTHPFAFCWNAFKIICLPTTSVHVLVWAEISECYCMCVCACSFSVIALPFLCQPVGHPAGLLCFVFGRWPRIWTKLILRHVCLSNCLSF